MCTDKIQSGGTTHEEETKPKILHPKLIIRNQIFTTGGQTKKNRILLEKIDRRTNIKNHLPYFEF